jgi:hypothetical protein
MAASLACACLYFVDIASMFLHSTRQIIAISVFLAVVLGIIDIVIMPDAWYINDLIGVLVAGAIIKFVVIKKLKAVVIPLTCLWVFFIFRQFIILFHL